jgi:hypothetical protein
MLSTTNRLPTCRQFPELHGTLRFRGLSLHFWDAPDDIHAADMDLLFEGDRVYLHGAKGRFGAVPLTLTGDLDLNPDGGQYRSAREGAEDLWAWVLMSVVCIALHMSTISVPASDPCAQALRQHWPLR